MSASPKSAGSSGATTGHGHHTASQRALLAALRAWQTGMAPRAALLVLAVSFLLAVTIVASTAGDGGGRSMTALESARLEDAPNRGFVGGAAPMMMADGDMAMGAPAPQPAMAPMRAGGAHGKRYRANGAGRAAPAPPADAMFGGGGGPEFAAASAESVRSSVAEMTSLREQQKQAAGGGEDPSVLSGLVLIKDGSVSGEVPDVKSAVSRLEALVASPAVGGHVESSNLWTDQWLAQRLADAAARAEARRTGVHLPPGGQAKPLPGPTGANVNLRVPVDRFESTLGALRELLAELGGSVTSESSSARDVTSEYVDVVARQRADELAAAQLEKLMAAAATVGDVLAVKRELDHVTQRLEGAKAQRKSLEGRASFSSLHVSLTLPQPSPEPQPSPSPRPGWSPLRTAGNAVGTLARGGQLAVDVVVYSVVLAVPVALAVALAAVASRSVAPLARPVWARLVAAATAKVLPTSAAGGGAAAGASATSPGGSGAGSSAYHAIPASAADD